MYELPIHVMELPDRKVFTLSLMHFWKRSHEPHVLVCQAFLTMQNFYQQLRYSNSCRVCCLCPQKTIMWVHLEHDFWVDFPHVYLRTFLSFLNQLISVCLTRCVCCHPGGPVQAGGVRGFAALVSAEPLDRPVLFLHSVVNVTISPIKQVARYHHLLYNAT